MRAIRAMRFDQPMRTQKRAHATEIEREKQNEKANACGQNIKMLCVVRLARD